MYQFPVRSNKLILTQPFRTVKPVDISKGLSIETTDHNGVDVVCGTNEETWGKECVWPFPWTGTAYWSVVNAPFGATKARAQIDTVDPATGIAYSIIYLHLSSVTKTKLPDDNNIVTYNQGDVIGKIGNNGSVRPVPTPERPLDGTHLHLGLGIKKPGEINYIMVDPLLYFSLTPTPAPQPQPVPTPAPQPFKFNNNLWFGQKSYEVIQLQKRIGVNPQTGFFGPITLGKVISYQKANGITPTGFVGPLTRARLNTTT